MSKPNAAALERMREFRNAVGTFATGVTVVTTCDSDGEPQGFTANSFTSVSLDPPLILVCIAHSANCFPVFADCSGFAVNILSEEQRAVSDTFASSSGNRFNSIDWRFSESSNPLLMGSVSWLDCQAIEKMDAGDHLILLGRVTDFDYTRDTPLGYCGGNYITFDGAAKALLSTGKHGHLEIGAIVEYEASLYLPRKNNGMIRPPSADRLGSPADEGSLQGLLTRTGIQATLSFVYSVYEDDGLNRQCIYYRGVASQISRSARQDLIPLDEIPWDQFGDAAVVSMLQRYVRERRSDAFGIYIGDEKQGKVEQLAHSGRSQE